MSDVPAPYRNSLEAAYAKHLAAEQAAGRIASWAYESDVLILDGETLSFGQQYTPDFTVTLPDGSIEYHETKGLFYEQDKVRTKQAAARYLNHRFIIVKRKNRKWVLTPIARKWEQQSQSKQKRFDAILRARKRNEAEYKQRDYALQAEIHKFLETYPRFKPRRPNEEM